ncbi:hypothetical protein [Stieleria sp.]|uniref:hypothetical protein n=1 Tax=Stieleria sp. TaxID=2795976 RepID=UPI003566A735
MNWLSSPDGGLSETGELIRRQQWMLASSGGLAYDAEQNAIRSQGIILPRMILPFQIIPPPKTRSPRANEDGPLLGFRDVYFASVAIPASRCLADERIGRWQGNDHDPIQVLQVAPTLFSCHPFSCLNPQPGLALAGENVCLPATFDAFRADAILPWVNRLPRRFKPSRGIQQKKDSSLTTSIPLVPESTEGGTRTLTPLRELDFESLLPR